METARQALLVPVPGCFLVRTLVRVPEQEEAVPKDEAPEQNVLKYRL